MRKAYRDRCIACARARLMGGGTGNYTVLVGVGFVENAHAREIFQWFRGRELRDRIAPTLSHHRDRTEGYPDRDIDRSPP